MVKPATAESPSVKFAFALPAVVLAVAIFVFDTYVPLGIAVAVLYVLVILLAANFMSRRATIYVSIACAVLAIASYVMQHGDFEVDAPLARLGMSLSAVAITGFLVFRNQSSQMNLRRAEKEMRDILDAIPALVVRTLPDGRVDFLNAQWKAQGFSESDIRTDRLRLVHPDDLADVLEKRALFNSGAPYDVEFRLMRADGAYRWILNRMVSLLNDDGKVIAHYAAATDIDDRKRAEAALTETQAELAHVARVTTLGEFTASIAHEVNQPLATIITNGEVGLRILERQAPDLEELRGALRDVVSNGRRASEIIMRVRALARKDPSKKTQLALNEVIEEVVPLLKGEALRHQLSLRLEFAQDLAPVWGDRIELQQVLINLIVNGMEAMSATRSAPAEVVIRSCRGDAGEAVVAIVDRGVGLDEPNAKQMFNAFFTTKPSGMGMGLAICRSIIENHGGRLWAANNEGLGATVQFTLPPFDEANA